MQLKLFLNKFLKVDNIEYYSFRAVKELKKSYDELLEKSEGMDPDFPMITVGDGKGEKKIKGRNKIQVEDALAKRNGMHVGEDLPEKEIPYETEEILNLHR